MSDIKPYDTKTDKQHDIQYAIVCPRCPVCGAETVLLRKHTVLEVVTRVFRCTMCDVQYPVVSAASSGM